MSTRAKTDWKPSKERGNFKQEERKKQMQRLETQVGSLQKEHVESKQAKRTDNPSGKSAKRASSGRQANSVKSRIPGGKQAREQRSWKPSKESRNLK